MTSTPLDVAYAYYTAFGTKNRNEMVKYLAPNVHLLSPLASLTGAQDVLDAAERYFPFFNTMTIRAKFGLENQAMLVLDQDCPKVGLFRTASLVTVADNQITNIELFLDPRPFENKEIFMNQ